MQAIPGGHVPPGQVVGRDRLIQRLWRVLERQSVLLTAERRMGKTSIIKKMVAEHPGDGLYFYQDLEGVESELEFVEKVLQSVDSELSKRQRFATRARQFLKDVGGTEIGGVLKLPESSAQQWKRLLERVIEDLIEHHADGLVVFFWDEMPLMLHNVRTRSGELAAMQVLDHLRALRQSQPRLRMVFTGSIGLHNVVTSLRRSGHANDATNDMHTQDVPPLSMRDATDLARRLLAGERIETGDADALALAIADAVDCVPYFIHHVVDDLAQCDELCDATLVRRIVAERLTDAHDRWHLRYYQERIGTYYSKAEAQIALGLLDALAASDRSLPFDGLFDLLKSAVAIEDEELTRDVLVRLQQDHYVVRDGDGAYRFRFPLIRRFWRVHRGLGA